MMSNNLYAVNAGVGCRAESVDVFLNVAVTVQP